MKYQKSKKKIIIALWQIDQQRLKLLLDTFYLKIQSHQSLRNFKQSLEVYSIILIFVQNF